MKYLSLFTGVGGFDLGFDRAGMECVAQVEQDKHCLNVLEHHWPDVPKIKDVRNVTSEHFAHTTIDLVCGGFPCQDVSVAGNRAGLAGDRSGLWFEFLRILQCVKPDWVVIENVPGLLSSNAGRDFATILHGLGECGYQSAWRILDSQYWGVAQRRRRLYLVGCLTDGRAAEVLFEREGGYWNSPTRSEARERIAGTLGASAGQNRGLGLENEADFLITAVKLDNTKSNGWGVLQDGTTHTLGGAMDAVTSQAGVRRLTPLECERLQGFPDGWSDVCGASDAQRYKQMGNAVTVSVTEWIGKRIVEADKS